MFRSKKGIVFLLIILFYILFLFYKSSFFWNGNNEHNIVRVIDSLEMYDNKESIEMINSFDLKDQRIVAFLYHNNPSYILFNKNSLGNYTFSYSETKSGESLSIFSIDWIDKNLVVTNDSNKIAKMVVKANGKIIINEEIRERQKSASFYVIDNLPKMIDHGYEMDYKFYDKDGKLIVEEE